MSAMTTNPSPDACAREIEALHEFFGLWFRAELPATDAAFARFDHFERRMDNLESQLESMDVGRDVPPDLAAEIDALAGDERINDELERLRTEMGGKTDPQ